MTTPTVRTLSYAVRQALRLAAAQHGRSLAAEVREILQSAVNSDERVKLGSLLADVGRRAELTDAQFAVFEQKRSKLASPVG